MPGRSMMATSRLSGSAAKPVCCSTVTPGKLATFWRSPVSLLNSVVLPQLGGPTNTTVLVFLAGATAMAALQPVQADNSPLPCGRGSVWDYRKARGGFGTKSDFRAIHLEDSRLAAGCAAACGYRRAGKKTQFHEAAGFV